MWPSARQTMLLRAGLREGEAAAEAFRDWCAATDFEGPVDEDSYRLLPLVHDNLQGAGADVPKMALIAGVRRQAWVKSQLRLRWAQEAVAALRQGDVPVMMIKGLALSLEAYANPSLRPMSDVDLLVPPDRVAAAIHVLGQAGFAPDPAAGVPIDRGPHAIQLCGPGGAEVDLHCRPLTGAMRADERRWLWDTAMASTLGEVRVLRPAPTALLLYAVLHGIWAQVTSPIRWIPDAVTLLRKDGDAIDWDRLLDFAARHHLLARLGAAMTFLQREFAVILPPRVAARLASVPPTLIERLEGPGFPRDDGRRPGAVLRMRYRAVLATRLLIDGRARELSTVAEAFLANRARRLWRRR